MSYEFDEHDIEEHRRAIKRINDGYPCLYCNATYDKKNDPDRRMQGQMFLPPIIQRTYDTVTVNHHQGCPLGDKIDRQQKSYAVGDEMRRQEFLKAHPEYADPMKTKTKKPRKKK